MNNTFVFYCILFILIAEFIFATTMNYLNAQQFKNPIPEDLNDVYNTEEYEKSQAYKLTNYKYNLFTSVFSLLLILAFLLFGGFAWVDSIAQNQSDNTIVQALVFFGIIMIGSDMINIPFSYYQTFVIEESFGFNKTTKATFFIDKLKQWLMTVIVGGTMLSLIIWFFQWAGTAFWLYTWALIAIFTLFINVFYSRLIVPLFNKQEPLEEGTLKEKIKNYAAQVGFDLQQIFVINGSKRSTKANAYFSGFGKEKRVTLYDTLIDDLEEEEILAVLAHEIGHYKKKHIVYNLVTSILLTGFMLLILSFFINNPEVSLAIGVDSPSFHASLIGFGILYSPISEITGLLMNYFSRKFEYQADDYAKKTYAAIPLVTALKKLSKNSLSNLTPHPAYVFMHYSHPPLIDRIRNLKA
ncbi:M48 family metallopeptidase [Maribacter ulvicola]|uniref:STE24 endopeptidase n=1 Tax=Maribacter ulvicola TaxID=228959 RepID=A0A1N6VTK8_9FLAO|nr:M48 family metallopeptidase [Maribacter ulvicola]SIQ81192.1 STE24 endopeptidase [Maribacter ulvicola]